MTRPAVGAAVWRCAGGFAYGGAPACGTCSLLVDGIVEEGWRSFLRRWDAGHHLGQAQEVALAEMVVGEPEQHDWRVVDAALDRLVCPGCSGRLGRGPVGCARCDLANGLRYAAVETDRPGVPAANEHAIRVNVSVVRRPSVTSANDLLARRLLLPVLLVGLLPTTQETQRIDAMIKQATGASLDQKAQLIGRAIEDMLQR